jgi:hypothetical protein
MEKETFFEKHGPLIVIIGLFVLVGLATAALHHSL